MKPENTTVAVVSDHASCPDPRGTAGLDTREACQRKHIFDMTCGSNAPRNLAVATVRRIADQYAASRERSGWLWLCSGIPCQDKDPINWMPSAAEYDYLDAMLDFLYALPLTIDEMRDMSEFPIRRVVDGLLMSGAFWGCGCDLIGKWASASGYDALLNWRDQEGMTTPRLKRTRAFISRVAHHFEHLGAPRLQLFIGAALSYYGGDTRMSYAQQRLIEWAMSQGLYPLLLDLALNDFLIPESGLLRPNIAKITKHSRADRLQYASIFGRVDLAKAVSVFDQCLLNHHKPEDPYAIQLLSAYLRWHIRWGLLDRLCAEDAGGAQCSP